MGKPAQLVSLGIMHLSCPSKWAYAEVAKHGIALNGNGAATKELNHGINSIGSTMTRLANEMHKQNKIEARKEKKENETKKGTEKFVPFVCK